MHRIPTVIQGHQRVAQTLKSSDASKLLKQKLQELKNADGCIKKAKANQLSSVKQGTQREYFHTYGTHSRAAFTGPYEPWSDDMACVLQGTCMPGSTRYCRTNSMFGKLDLADIQQGSQHRNFSTMLGSIRSFHTTTRPVPIYNITRDFKTSSALQSCSTPLTFKSELWAEDIACILQGTCLPGSTRYCRTNSMFGKLQMSDILQDAPRRYYSTGAPNDGGQVSQKGRLKLAVRDYGSTVIVFHVCISLISLGSFYLAVSRWLCFAFFACLLINYPKAL